MRQVPDRRASADNCAAHCRHPDIHEWTPERQSLIPRTLQSKEFSVRRLAYLEDEECEILRWVPVEAPIAIEVCGIGYAVMMATPSDLPDYALGFALAEGLISGPDELEDIGVHRTDGGGFCGSCSPRTRRRKSSSEPDSGSRKAVADFAVSQTSSMCFVLSRPSGHE